MREVTKEDKRLERKRLTVIIYKLFAHLFQKAKRIHGNGKVAEYKSKTEKFSNNIWQLHGTLCISKHSDMFSFRTTPKTPVSLISPHHHHDQQQLLHCSV